MTRRLGGIGLVLAGVLVMGCGPSGKQGKTTPTGPKNVEFEPEEIVVKTPAQTATLDFEDEKVIGSIYQPDGEPESYTLTPAKPLPKGKDALSLEVRRAAFAKAKGKAKINEAEWLGLAIVNELATQGDKLPAEQAAALRQEAVAALEAAVAEKGAGETTWVMLATLQYSAGLTGVSATTWEKVETLFPKSKLAARYKKQHAWALFATDPAAATALYGEALPDAEAQYFNAWKLRKQGDFENAVTVFENALKANPPPKLAPAILHDLLHTLAWRGPSDKLPLQKEVRDLGGDAAAQDANLLEVGEFLADKGDLAGADALLTDVVKDPAATPAQVVKAYEIRAQAALADRRLADLATLIEELVKVSTSYPEGSEDRVRAAKIAELVATTLYTEWGKTHEQAAAETAKRAYAALNAAGLDYKQQARDLDEAMNAPEAPPEMESNKDVVRRVVRLNMNGVRHCYERALSTGGSQAGTWRFSLVPMPSGAGTVVKTNELLGLDPAVGTCMETQAKNWKFPPHAKAVTIVINYGMMFSN